MLELRDVYAGYYPDMNILQGVSMTAEEGTITSVIGTNGVGKSTLLKTVYGFLSPRKGTIALEGKSIAGANPYRMPELGLTYIPQRRNVFPEMTVEENLQLGGWTFRRDKARIRRQLEENYDRFPILRNRRKQRAGNLSGGQQRMVELGRAMMIEPRLMLVDEPTAGLAPKVAAEIYDKLQALRDEGITVVLVDQNVRQAIEVSDYVYALALGKNMAEASRGGFEELRNKLREWL
ncbi:ATP-binding cassette domain-containing protein [Candidatus Fermentibacteria bacterium]|nr:ATP-binding cassette domain-containing protein [Candidatus Fermentibacteria bacterium]